MTAYKRLIKANGWYICYFAHNKKVIEVTFSAKHGQLAGWCQNLTFWQAV